MSREATQSALVPYAKAKRMLMRRFLRLTDAEIAMWALMEQLEPSIADLYPEQMPELYPRGVPDFTRREGQLRLFSAQGQRKKWNPVLHEGHSALALSRLFFDPQELRLFDPEQGYGRWISFAVLKRRWKRFGLSDGWIEELVTQLHDEAREHLETALVHADAAVPKQPTLYAVDPETWWAKDVRQGLFQLRQVEQLERELGLVPEAPVRVQELELLLLEIESRDKEFNRARMPGTKKEFLRFLKTYAAHHHHDGLSELAELRESTLQKTLHDFKAGFRQGARDQKEKYWREKFPEIYSG